MPRKVKIPSEDAVLDYLRHSRRGPMKAKEIAKGMDVAPRDFRDFRLVLRGMLERGRLYLHRDVTGGEPQGTLLYAALHQVAAREYSCRRPLPRGGTIVWPVCTITLEEDDHSSGTSQHRTS